MIRHVVLFKFREDADQEKVSHFLAELNKYPAENPDITNWTAGPELTDPIVNPGGFDYGVTCDLADRDAAVRYREHPFHRALAPLVMEIRESTTSFEFVVPD